MVRGRQATFGGVRTRKTRKAIAPEVITPAPEVRRLADDLIQAVHTHLKDCAIEYLFTSKSRQSKGEPLYTRVKRLSAPERFLSSGRQSTTEGCMDFQVVVDRALWFNASGAKQHAMVDHALEFIGYDDEKDRFVLRHPDVHEFTGVVERNGLWSQRLRQFGEACAEQISLFTERVQQENAENNGRAALVTTAEGDLVAEPPIEPAIPFDEPADEREIAPVG